jgi:hypothetical protein
MNLRRCKGMTENQEIPNKDGVGQDGANPTQRVLINENRVVNELNKKIRESERPYYEIGKILLDTYFEGDPEKARAKDPTKNASFRKLAKRTDLERSFSWLHKALSVTIQDDLFQQKGIDANSVSYSIKVELLPLPEENKIPLAEKALSEALTVRQVRREVKQVKLGVQGADDFQKLDHPMLEKSLVKLSKIIEDLDSCKDTMAASLGTLDLQAMVKLSDQINQGQILLRRLDAKFSALIQDLEDNMKSAYIR